MFNLPPFTRRNKTANSEEDKKDVMTELRVHKLRAKSFFDILRDDRNFVEIFSFDCHKNMPLPRIPDQATYCGCGGQNKDSMLVSMGKKWFSVAPRNIKKVEFISPVTGHSSLPPGRVFGQVEKFVRKQPVLFYLRNITNLLTAKQP